MSDQPKHVATLHLPMLVQDFVKVSHALMAVYPNAVIRENSAGEHEVWTSSPAPREGGPTT